MVRTRSRLSGVIGRPREQRRMVVTEVVILMACVLIACAICATVLPAAITSHYEENRNFLTAPF